MYFNTYASIALQSKDGIMAKLKLSYNIPLYVYIASRALMNLINIVFAVHTTFCKHYKMAVSKEFVLFGPHFLKYDDVETSVFSFIV